MSSIEKTLFLEFRIIFFEILVPLEIQNKIPTVRAAWKQMATELEIEKRLKRIFSAAIRNRTSVGLMIVGNLKDREPDTIFIKGEIYRKISQDQTLMRGFLNRPLTNGNEQCPYWDGFRYTEPPSSRMVQKP